MLASPTPIVEACAPVLKELPIDVNFLIYNVTPWTGHIRRTHCFPNVSHTASFPLGINHVTFIPCPLQGLCMSHVAQREQKPQSPVPVLRVGQKLLVSNPPVAGLNRRSGCQTFSPCPHRAGIAEMLVLGFQPTLPVVITICVCATA